MILLVSENLWARASRRSPGRRAQNLAKSPRSAAETFAFLAEALGSAGFLTTPPRLFSWVLLAARWLPVAFFGGEVPMCFFLGGEGCFYWFGARWLPVVFLADFNPIRLQKPEAHLPKPPNFQSTRRGLSELPISRYRKQPKNAQIPLRKRFLGHTKLLLITGQVRDWWLKRARPSGVAHPKH